MVESHEIDRLVTRIARALVDFPEDVLVNTVASEHSMILELNVAKSDVGKVIGKHGRTAQALRIIVGAAASKLKCNTVLQINE